MNNLKSYNSFVNESADVDEFVWSPVIDGRGPFLKSKKMKKSELSKKDKFPFFKESEKGKCDDYVENENELLFANSDR